MAPLGHLLAPRRYITLLTERSHPCMSQLREAGPRELRGPDDESCCSPYACRGGPSWIGGARTGKRSGRSMRECLARSAVPRSKPAPAHWRGLVVQQRDVG